MQSAAVRLKELREAAEPRISIREMAHRLGVDHSTYVRYERPERFKKEHLPLPFARKVAAVLADHSVNPEEVLALAGVRIDEVSTSALSAREEQLLENFRQVDPAGQKAVLLLVGRMAGAADGSPSSSPGRRIAAATGEGEQHGEQQATQGAGA